MQPLQVLEIYHAYEAIAEATGTGFAGRKDGSARRVVSHACVCCRSKIHHQTGEWRDARGVSEGSLLDALACTIRYSRGCWFGAPINMAGDVGAVAYAAIAEGEEGLASYRCNSGDHSNRCWRKVQKRLPKRWKKSCRRLPLNTNLTVRACKFINAVKK